MRDAFNNALVDIAARNNKVVLLTGDLGYTVFEKFVEQHSAQFFNMGVAEANMIGVACGLALSGFIPFVYSIATFATMRGFEQIRTDVCLHRANVKIIGSGAGLSYGHAGSTHHALEDIAIMRALPYMTVIAPSDRSLTYQATMAIVRYKGPVYLRLGKKGEPDIYDEKKKFTIGKATFLKERGDIALIATGNIVYNALQAAKMLKQKGISVCLVDMHTIKPLDVNLIKNIIYRIPYIYTVEEHSVIGGLGSAVADAIADLSPKKPVTLKKIGTPDSFIEAVGTQSYLRKLYGLTPQGIVTTVYQSLKNHA